MKKLLTAGLLSSLATSAFAYDAEVDINGEVVTESCTINNSSVAPTVINVDMPKINISALPSAGSWAMNTPFTVALTNCPDPVKVSWEKSSTVDAESGALVNTIAGTNAQIRVLDGNAQPINLNSDAGQVVTGGSANLRYFGQYYAKTAPVTPGKISTYGYITLTY
ncbi:fimbrial protein [Pseudomonas sp. SCB32]|uniref:fimbrial protein n=1 Tax=Pseudomonas sp. SCB32 TaxID=2653853 RepID=UPI0015B5B7C0|nr:fimbrial protein [Pseudomonas sp. SCB32]